MVFHMVLWYVVLTWSLFKSQPAPYSCGVIWSITFKPEVYVFDVVPVFPAAGISMPVNLAAVPVPMLITSSIALVRRYAVESLNTCLVTGVLSIRTFPSWSSILV